MPDKVSAEEIQRYVERMHTKMAAEPDQHAVSQAVTAVYEVLGKAPPKIIWCANPQLRNFVVAGKSIIGMDAY